MEKEEELTNTELTILEIISDHRTIHRIMIMGQMQEINKITGQDFDKALFRRSLLRLEKIDYIKRLLTDDNTFKITEKGKEIL